MTSEPPTTLESLEAQLLAAWGGDRVDVLNLLVEKLQWGSGNANRALELSEEACTLAEHLVDLPRISYSLLSVGQAYLRLARFKDASTVLQRALANFRDLRDRVGEQRSLSRLGDAYGELGQYTEALTCYLTSLQLSSETGDRRGALECHNNLGTFYENDLSDYKLAAEHYLASLRLADQLGNAQNRALALINLGEVRRKLGRPEDALLVHTEGLSLSLASGDMFLQAIAATGLGSDTNALGRFGEAASFFEQGRAAFQVLGEPRYELEALWGLGLAFSKLGEHGRACKHQQEALELARSISFPRGEIASLSHLGEVQLAAGYLDEALEPLSQALAAAELLGIDALSFEIHERLSRSYAAKGDFEVALTHHRRFNEIKEQVHDREVEIRAQALFVQLEVEKERHQTELHRLKNVELAQANEALTRSDQQKTVLLEQLGVQAERLAKLANEDTLTGLPNRRYIMRRLAEELRHSQEQTHVLNVVLIDIDNFKGINDTFSHAVGDKVLEEIAQLFMRVLRSGDVIARYGGEEFVLLLPRTSRDESLVVCERMRQVVAEHPWGHLHPELLVSVSMGLANSLTTGNDHEKLLSQADEQLYEAKRTGKNRVCSA